MRTKSSWQTCLADAFSGQSYMTSCFVNWVRVNYDRLLTIRVILLHVPDAHDLQIVGSDTPFRS